MFISCFFCLVYKFSIDNNGIIFFLNNRIINILSWDDIEFITIDRVGREIYININGKNNKNYYLDGTKKNIELIYMYVPYRLIQSNYFI